MRLFFALILLVSCSVFSEAFASDYRSDLNALYSQYNQRFDAQGKYRPNQRLADEFTQAQEAFAARLKAEGALQEILFVENSFDQKLWVHLYVFRDEQNQLLTVYWEQGKYQDAEVRSYLRFRSLQSVETGLKFVPVMNTHAFTVKSSALNPEVGGALEIIYAENISQQSMRSQKLFLAKNDQRWSLYLDQNHPVSRAWIDVWIRLLPPNGGVRSLKLY